MAREQATLVDERIRNGWLRATDAELLRDCREERYKSSGPGGQHRNKVETAVRVHHTPSGVSGQGEETRSQEENRRHALSRLRERIAFTVRAPFDLEAPDVPPEFTRQRRGSSIAANAKNPKFPLIVATALDALLAADGGYAIAARALGLTTSQLRKFLQSDRELWRAVSERFA
ncbi:MAG: peptide chain release factor-like protein [Chloroflexota bacterium]